MKKRIRRFYKRILSLVIVSIMAIGMFAGFPTANMTVEAAGYDLSNPRLDKENHIVTYDCVYFGNYWQEDTNGDGEANKEDNKTPIKWRVLSVDGDDAFLIADRNLDMQTYNDTHKDVTWETCTMRSWLNGYGAASNICEKDYTGVGNSFINNAFNASEKNAIQNTALSNKDNPNYGTEGGNDTMDKIFLLSLEDIANEVYGFTNYGNKTGESDSSWGNGDSVGKEYYGNGENDYYNIWDYAKLRTNTAFAKGSDTASNYTYTSNIGTGWWWLRSPSDYSYYASIVGFDGRVRNYGDYSYFVYIGLDGLAVCPALHLNLSSSSVWSKAGTVTCKSGNVSGGGSWGDEDYSEITSVKIEKNKYGICVVDEKGKPVEDATVNFAGTEKKTDKDGWAIFNKVTTGTVTLSVKKGDSAYQDSAYSKKSNNFDKIVLYSDKLQKYKLNWAQYSSEQSVDILNGTKRITLDSAVKDFNIYVATNAPKTDIKKYVLMQGKNEIAETTDGSFMNIKTDKFKAGRNVGVRIYYSDKDYVLTGLNLEFIKSDLKDIPSSLELGDKVSFKVNSDVPLLGGSTFSVDIPDLPIIFKVSDDTVKIGFNVTDESFNNEKQYETLNKLLYDSWQSRKTLGTDTQNISKNLKKYMKDKKKLGIGEFSKKSDLTLVGCAEAKLKADGTFDSATGYICLTYTASASFDWQTVVYIIPVTANLKGEIEFDVNASAKYVFGNQSLTGNVLLNVKPSITVFGGVGVSKAAAVGAFGKGAMDIEILIAEYKGNSPGVNKVDLTAEAGLRAYAGPLEHKKTWKKATWNLYTRTNKVKTATYNIESTSFQEEVMSSIYNMSNYELAEEPVVEAKNSNADNQIYENARPTVVSCGNDIVMVSSDVDSAKGVCNQNVIKYSYYNNGSFTDAAAIDNSGAMQLNPYLYSDGNDIWLIYQESKEIFDELENVSDFTDKLEIKAAKWNESGKKFDSAIAVTDNDVYDYMPRIVRAGGELYAVWMSNEENDYFGQNDKNSVLYSIYQNNVWSQPQTLADGMNAIADFSVGEMDSQIVVALSEDSDNELETVNDRTLVMLMQNGTSVPVDSGAVSGLQFTEINGKNALLYNKESQLMYVDDADGEQSALIAEKLSGFSDDYTVIDNKIYYVSATETGSGIYMVDMNAENSEPVQIKNEDTYIENLSVINNSDEYLIIHTQKDVVIDEEEMEIETSLVCDNLEPIHRVEITSCDYDGLAAANEATIINLTVKNRGTEQVNNLSITVEDEDGQTVAQEEKEVALELNEEKEISYTFEVPDIDTLTDYKIYVCEKGQSDVDNNGQAEVTFGYTDLSVSAEENHYSTGNGFQVVVQNLGNYDTEATLVAYTDDENTYLFEESIGELASGETYAKILIPDSEWYTDGCCDIHFAVKDSVNDGYGYNNTAEVMSYKDRKVQYYNNGELMDECIVAYGNKLIEPCEPEADGTDMFSGWYVDEACTTLWDFDKDVVTANMCLYAGWKSEENSTNPQEGEQNPSGDGQNSGNSNGQTNPNSNTSQTVLVGKMTISGISKKIAFGKKIKLTPAILPDNATNKDITWISSNPQYATVSNKGVVATKKKGIGKTVTITASTTDGSGVKAEYKIKIVKHAVKSIKLPAKSKTVVAGKNLKLKAVIKTTGKTANKTLKWSSSNEKYATVTNKGVVKTKKAGKGKMVKITAMATDGTGKKATIKIKIK